MPEGIYSYNPFTTRLIEETHRTEQIKQQAMQKVIGAKAEAESMQIQELLELQRLIRE